MVLGEFFGYLQGKRHGARKAMQELEISLRAKDPVTPLKDTELYSTYMRGTVVFLLNFIGSACLVRFATRKAPKFLGTPPISKSLSLFYSLGCASFYADMKRHEFYHVQTRLVLQGGEEGMKMELAKIILNNHSTNELLVKAVNKYFIAENLLSDLHQEQRLFRWRQRNSYVDYTFKERMKQYEANNSDDDEAESSHSWRRRGGEQAPLGTQQTLSCQDESRKSTGDVAAMLTTD